MAEAIIASNLLQKKHLNPFLCLYWSLNWEGKRKWGKKSTYLLHLASDGVCGWEGSFGRLGAVFSISFPF